MKLERASENPILKPRGDVPWESHYVFNTAAIYLEGKVHFLYRAIGHSGLSVLGYASSRDGIHIDERLATPSYICSGAQKRERTDSSCSFHAYSSGGSFSGCEDPRLTQVDDTIYMTYTSFGGWGSPPGVALTSISVSDFLEKQWAWRRPVLISSPHEMHKNWVLFPEKINGKFAILHGISPTVLIDYFDDLNFQDDKYIPSRYQASGREGHWDSLVRGVGPPPIKTSDGWLLLYHAMDKRDPNRYKIGAMILDERDPKKILFRCNAPLLEPHARYENEGFKSGVIYSCGAVVMGDELLVYYGGADTVVCVATTNLASLLEQIKHAQAPKLRSVIPLEGGL